MDSRWKIYVCERCYCYFVLDKTNETNIINCPNCCSDDEITETGEYLPSGNYYNEEGKELR